MKAERERTLHDLAEKLVTPERFAPKLGELATEANADYQLREQPQLDRFPEDTGAAE